MQGNNNSNVAEFLKNFETSESFNNYCFSIPKERIQKFTTNDWISFLYGVNILANKLKCKTADEFVNKHVSALSYMYANYRPDKRKSREIKNFAYKIADKLASSPEFANFYYQIDIMATSTQYMDYKAVKMMRTAIYDEFIGDNFTKEFFKPSITLIEANSKKLKNAGYYKHGNLLTHKVVLKKGSVDFCNVAAHEIYHSLQHLGSLRRTKFLKKFGIKFAYDKKMAELYKLNHNFYLDYTIDLKGYKKQPLEYDARLFATCFERRLRKNLRASENNWGMLYQTTQILRGCSIFENNVQYDENSISVLLYTPEKRQFSLLKELTSKYLTGAEIFKSDETSTILFISRNTQNIININKLYTNARKHQNNNVSSKEFFKKFFPLTYQKFYATEKEKMEYKPVLSRVIINRIYSKNQKTDK